MYCSKFVSRLPLSVMVRSCHACVVGCHSQDLSTGASYPSTPRLSWLAKLYENLTYVRMQPAAIALNFSFKDIRNDVRQIMNGLVWGSLTLAPINCLSVTWKLNVQTTRSWLQQNARLLTRATCKLVVASCSYLPCVTIHFHAIPALMPPLLLALGKLLTSVLYSYYTSPDSHAGRSYERLQVARVSSLAAASFK